MFTVTTPKPNRKLERIISTKISGIIERVFDGDDKIKTQVIEDIVQFNIPSNELFKNLSFTFKVAKNDNGKFMYRLMSTDGYIESDESLIKFLENFSKK